MALPEIRDEKEKSKSVSKSLSNEKTPGNEKIDVYHLLISFEMGCMTVKLSRLGGREYREGQDSVTCDSAELDFDPDFDSDEVNSDTENPPLVAEFSCRLLVALTCGFSHRTAYIRAFAMGENGEFSCFSMSTFSVSVRINGASPQRISV